MATRLGSLPPKTLLFSSSTPGKDVEDTAPDVVIGLLSKPVRASVLWDIVELLEKTRSCCPGLIAELCPYTRDGAVPDGRPCDSVLYASCEHYRKTCGRELRRWIADRQHPHADWPEAQAAS